jgi:hypothetical protein
MAIVDGTSKSLKAMVANLQDIRCSLIGYELFSCKYLGAIVYQRINVKVQSIRIKE